MVFPLTYHSNPLLVAGKDLSELNCSLYQHQECSTLERGGWKGRKGAIYIEHINIRGSFVRSCHGAMTTHRLFLDFRPGRSGDISQTKRPMSRFIIHALTCIVLSELHTFVPRMSYCIIYNFLSESIPMFLLYLTYLFKS